MDKLKLYIATIYPEFDKETIEMEHTYAWLDREIGDKLKIIPLWLPVGTFKKGVDNPKIEDTEEVIIRQQYIDYVDDGDFILIADSDEVFGGACTFLPDLMQAMLDTNTLVGQVLEVRPSINGIMVLRRPRLILKREGMRYEFKHDRLMYQGVNIISKNYKKVAECHQLFFQHNIQVLDMSITDNVNNRVVVSKPIDDNSS